MLLNPDLASNHVPVKVDRCCWTEHEDNLEIRSGLFTPHALQVSSIGQTTRTCEEKKNKNIIKVLKSCFGVSSSVLRAPITKFDVVVAGGGMQGDRHKGGGGEDPLEDDPLRRHRELHWVKP